jgi:hypothetical protein
MKMEETVFGGWRIKSKEKSPLFQAFARNDL